MKEQQIQQPQWEYKGEVVTAESVPENAVGMVYKIVMYPTADMKRWIETGHLGMKEEHATKVIYIGKKQLTSTTKSKIGKRAIAAERASRADGKAKTVKRVTKSSNWMSYTGSCARLNEDIKLYPDNYTREVLHWCYSKKNMSYMEVVEQVKRDVLHIDSYNDHILNFYRHDANEELYKVHKEKMKTIVRKPRIKK